MSKLNRREFKELLTEWHNNFINESSVVKLKSILSLHKDLITQSQEIEDSDIVKKLKGV